MGGVWEQQIRTARSILNALLITHGRSLKDEALHTLLIEVEAVVNDCTNIQIVSNIQLCTPFPDLSRLEVATKVE